MSSLEVQRAAVERLVPEVYDGITQQFGFQRGKNMAGSSQCHILTRGLQIALSHAGHEVSREYHESDDGKIWHYVIAHRKHDRAPSEDDIITDLNPWQYMRGNMSPDHTFLHGPREEIMDRLRKEGAPDYFVALRSLATIKYANTLHPGKASQ